MIYGTNWILVIGALKMIFFLTKKSGNQSFFILDFWREIKLQSQFCYALASNSENLVSSSHIMMTLATMDLFIIVSLSCGCINSYYDLFDAPYCLSL
jgi:hypothetical protein